MINFLKRKRWLVIIVIILLAAGGFGYYKIKNRKFEVETAKIIRGDLVESISVSGEVKSHDQVDLKFQSTGIVSWLPVKVGDEVEAWQSLASLDTRILQASFEKARADWVSEVHDLKVAEDTYEGSADVVNAEAAKTQAKADIDAYWNLLQIAERNLRNASLFTPIAGTVVQINVEKGVMVTATTGTAIVVADPNNLYVYTEVDESDFGKLELGQKVEIELEAYPDEPLEGEILEIAPSIITNDEGDKVVEVKVAFSNAQPQNLLIGMTGDVDIVTEKEKDVLLVPVEAVFVKDEKNYVYRVVNGTAVLTGIEIGLENDEHIEVISGLNEGDVVAVEKTDQIEEGMRVSGY